MLPGREKEIDKLIENLRSGKHTFRWIDSELELLDYHGRQKTKIAQEVLRLTK